jgi:pimeloyl-ACP methyl ester carboxylesterase
MAIVDSNGTRIYYEVHGEGSPIVFVHGSGGHHAAWWQQVVALRGDHTVVTLDLRGFGKSDSDETYDSLNFPSDIVAVLEDADLTDAVLVGQSIGAAAALKAALRVPERVRGVILAHSLGGIDAPDVTPLVKADRAEAEKLPVIDRLLTQQFRQEQEAMTFLFTQMGTFNTARMQDLRNLATDGPTVADISPTTVTAAHRLVEGSLLRIIPEAPHSMYWERPDLFNAAVAELTDALADQRVEVA